MLKNIYSSVVNLSSLRLEDCVMKVVPRVSFPLDQKQKTTVVGSTVKLFFIKTFNLIKPLIILPHFLTSGGLALLYISSALNSYKYTFLRTKWILWVYISQMYQYHSMYLTTLQLYGWGIRSRRLFRRILTFFNKQHAKYFIIKYRYDSLSYFFKKRRIKRWLKKKYTIRLWR